MDKNKWYLGRTKGSHPEPVYLTDFSWECEWYWSGGYIGNSRFHAHFDGAFLDTPDIRGHILGNFVTPWTIIPNHLKNAPKMEIRNGCSIWEPLSFFLDESQYDGDAWWRIKDLFKQFYRLRDAAEVFQLGGHCSGKGRNPSELNLDMAKQINKHIAEIVIPEIKKAMGPFWGEK
jgi:hypothetical protein